MLSVWLLRVDRYRSQGNYCHKTEVRFFKPHYYSVNKINHIFDPRRIASNEMAVTAEPQQQKGSEIIQDYTGFVSRKTLERH